MSFEQDWTRLYPCLARAAERSDQGWTEGGLLNRVAEGSALFWPGERSAALSETIKDCRIWLAGGAVSELLAMEGSATQWAKANGFDRISLDGRRGWERVLTPLGYRLEAVLVKDLNI